MSMEYEVLFLCLWQERERRRFPKDTQQTPEGPGPCMKITACELVYLTPLGIVFAVRGSGACLGPNQQEADGPALAQETRAASARRKLNCVKARAGRGSTISTSVHRSAGHFEETVSLSPPNKPT